MSLEQALSMYSEQHVASAQHQLAALEKLLEAAMRRWPAAERWLRTLGPLATSPAVARGMMYGVVAAVVWAIRWRAAVRARNAAAKLEAQEVEQLDRRVEVTAGWWSKEVEQRVLHLEAQPPPPSLFVAATAATETEIPDSPEPSPGVLRAWDAIPDEAADPTPTTTRLMTDVEKRARWRSKARGWEPKASITAKSESLAKLDPCEVYSNSRQAWCAGSVKELNANKGTVVVEYKTAAGATMQKLLPVGSPHVRKTRAAADSEDGASWPRSGLTIPVSTDRKPVLGVVTNATPGRRTPGKRGPRGGGGGWRRRKRPVAAA